MTKKNKIIAASLFFLIVSILEVCAIVYAQTTLEMIAKPLITTGLVILYLVAVSKPNFYYVSALFFAFWGDVLLLFQDQFFVLGLAAFLIAHILLITVSFKFLKHVSIARILTHCIPFLLILYGLLDLIYVGLDELFIPVLIYGVVISIFGTIALLVYTSERSVENGWLFLGAFTFIVSDSILAINKFYFSTELLSISIMLTYIIAQYLICRAMMVKLNDAEGMSDA